MCSLHQSCTRRHLDVCSLYYNVVVHTTDRHTDLGCLYQQCTQHMSVTCVAHGRSLYQ